MRVANERIMVFDGLCNFCSRSVRFILEHDVRGRIRFASVQSAIGRELLERNGIDPSDAQTFLFVDGDKVYMRSDAALEIARYLGRWRWLRILGVLPEGLRDAMYAVLAKNRYRWFGRCDVCFVPTEEQRVRFIDGPLASETSMSSDLIQRIKDGRTDLVFEYVAAGHAAASTDEHGTPLISWCAYYGDVSAIKHLLANGESLRTLGDNFDLNAAAFHGHWRLCQFLIEQGADVNAPLPDTGETPLHAALSTANRVAHDLVLGVLLGSGANPNCATKPGAETGSFMRDCRTKGETPLHRAAAFGTEETIRLLLDAGARVDARDFNGDSPLGWASWYLRPDSILRMLCYGDFQIRPNRRTMAAYLLGEPRV